MSGHGGKRKGAGRKPALPLHQRLLIGAECEQKWIALAQRKAIEKYKRTPRGRRISDIQAGAHQISLQFRRKNHPRLEEISDDIDFEVGNRGRYISLPVCRPRSGDRATIIKEVARQCCAEFGRLFTDRFIDECWREYRRRLPRS